MLANFVGNNISYTMSHKPKSSSSPRKKIPKYMPNSACNVDKSKSVNPIPCILETEEEAAGSQNVKSSNSKILENNDKKSGSNEKISAMSCEVKSSMVNFLQKPFSNGLASGLKSNIVEKESELIGMLTKQLYLAQNQMQRMQGILSDTEDRISSKELEITHLKQKVKEWETRSRNLELTHKKDQEQLQYQIEDSKNVLKRCLDLECKIFEMERFLADYGLTWVGEPEDPGFSSNDYINSCYAQLMANIEQLNLAVGKDEVHVHHNEDGGGATFKTPPCMRLKFYKNGMTVEEGAIRPYSHPTTQSFIRDILEGYFPSELQETYPNGVPFKVEDHRNETFIVDGAEYPGHGYRLGKQTSHERKSLLANIHKTARPRWNIMKEDIIGAEEKAFISLSGRSVRSKNSDTSLLDLTSLHSQMLPFHMRSHMNVELGFSSRREKSRTTKNAGSENSAEDNSLISGRRRKSSTGRTNQNSSVDRSSPQISPSRWGYLSNRSPKNRSRSTSLSSAHLSFRSLSGARNPRNSSLTRNDKNGDGNTRNQLRLSKSVHFSNKSPPPLLHQINEPTGKFDELRLKIRSLDGSTVYLVHILKDDSLARLYQMLDKAMSKTWPRKYKIVINGYETKRLENPRLSLREYGIVKDTVLHLVNN